MNDYVLYFHGIVTIVNTMDAEILGLVLDPLSYVTPLV